MRHRHRSSTLPAFVSADGRTVECELFVSTSFLDVARSLIAFGWRPHTKIAVRLAGRDEPAGECSIGDVLMSDPGVGLDSPSYWLALGRSKEAAAMAQRSPLVEQTKGAALA